jgi:hypothetical protein
MPTYVLHFTAGSNVGKGFGTVGFLEYKTVMVARETSVMSSGGGVAIGRDVPRKGYKAIIAGAEQGTDKVGDAERLHTLGDVTKWLRRQGVPIAGYVPAPGFCVDRNGKVYWTTPAGIPVNTYEK